MTDQTDPTLIVRDEAHGDEAHGVDWPVFAALGMRKWSVAIRATGPGPYDADWADDVLEAKELAGRGAVISAGGENAMIRFNVERTSLLDAVVEAFHIFESVVPGLRFSKAEVGLADELGVEL